MLKHNLRRLSAVAFRPRKALNAKHSGPSMRSLLRFGNARAKPEPLAESSLANEKPLKNDRCRPECPPSDDWMLIGPQENTGLNGRIDLLAITPYVSLVLVEF